MYANMKRVVILVSAIFLAISAMAATKAAYPGGEQAMSEYISGNLRYPAAAKSNLVEGVVTIEATVNADGTLGPLRIKRMVDPDLEQEAIRLVKNMPKWSPATDDSGKAVVSVVEIPVTFSLE